VLVILPFTVTVTAILVGITELDAATAVVRAE